MRKAMGSGLVGLACLLSAPTCSGQGYPHFSQEYDRIDDRTTLKLELGYIIRGDKYEVEMDVLQTFRGSGREKKRGSTGIHIVNQSEDGWIYLKFHAVTILADDYRMQFSPEHDGEIEKGYLLEFLWLRPTGAQFEKMVAARRVEGKVGIDEFELNGNQLAALKEFAALIGDPKRPVPVGRFTRPKTYDEIAAEKEALNEENAQLRRDFEKRKKGEAERAANRLTVALDRKLRLGDALEKTNPKGAIEYYEEVVKLAPDSGQAKIARERIKAMAKK